MGLTLDTGVFVAAERRHIRTAELLPEFGGRFSDRRIGISVVTIAELTPGVDRAATPQRSAARGEFVEAVARRIIVHDRTESLAKLVGRIEGEQAALGGIIEFDDLVIGATAFSLGFSVVPANLRYFKRIPGLPIHTL